MIQFDGHIFLDGLNAPTRWCLVLDFLKGFSSSEICLLKKPSMALQVKRISQKHPPNIVKHQKSIWNFTCCSFCSILNTWEDDPAWNQIDLDIVFFYFDGRSTTCFYHWMNIGVSGNFNLMCQLWKLVLGRENEGNCRYLQLIARWGVMNIAIVDVSETLLNQFILDYLQKRFFTPLGCIKPRK